jgi:hypothetical protein
MVSEQMSQAVIFPPNIYVVALYREYHTSGTFMILYVDFQEKYALFPQQMTMLHVP